MQFPLGGVGALAVQTQEVARLLPDTWSPLVDDIIKLSLLLAALGVLYRGLIKPARERLALLNKIWDKLVHETEPNSGTSLRDAIDRTDLRVAEMNDRFDDVEIYMQSLSGRLTKLDEKLSQHMDDVKDSGEG